AEPAYGFVASGSEPQGSTQAPQRGWSAATYIVDTRADVEEGEVDFPLGRLRWRAGTRGRFVVINEGPARKGYRICEWCGAGTPAASRKTTEHEHLLTRAS